MNQNKKPGRGRKIAVIAAILAILAGALLVAVGVIKTVQAGNESGRTTKSEKKSTADDTDEDEEDDDEEEEEDEEDEEIPLLEEIDVKEELSELGDVTDEMSAEDLSLLSEAKAEKEFSARGFKQNPITFYYSDEGEFIEEQEITAGGTEKHPFYETNYETPTGEVWSITLMGDAFYASPVSWYAQGAMEVPHIVSDSEQFMSYDANNNVFCVVELYDSELVMIQIDRVEAEVLDSLTLQDMEAQ